MVNVNNFVSLNEILSDVTVALDDKDTRKLSEGFYRAQVRNCVDELNFDTVFIEDKLDIEIPADHIIEFPAAAYRIKQVFIFTGDPDDIGYVQNVYWKKGARGAGFEKGYTSNNHPGNYFDIYHTNPMWGDIDIAYFFSYVNGDLTLSDACDSYDYARVVYDGVATGILADTALVPPEVRKAVVLWTIEKCASFLKVKYPGYRTVQLDAAAQLDEFGQNGAWAEAKRRIKYQGKKIRQDLSEYNARMRT